MSQIIQTWMELGAPQVLVFSLFQVGGGSSWIITWIFLLLQLTGNRFYIFHVCFSADVKQNCLTSKSSFHGCLRNLVLTKGQQAEWFDFSRAFDLRGVFPHSCPGAEHWTAAKPVWTERGFFCWSAIVHSHYVMKRRIGEILHLFNFLVVFQLRSFIFFSQKLYVCILTKWF